MDSPKRIWFKLFASCQIVKGKGGSLIYDLERAEFYDLPNSYVHLLEMTDTMDVEMIKANYDADQVDFIDAFFEKFSQREIGFFTDEPENFPKIDFTWESPYFISNAVIELNDISAFDFMEVICQLDKLMCRTIQLRLLRTFSKAEILVIARSFDNSQINSVEILFPYAAFLSNEDWNEVMSRQTRIRRVLAYAAPQDAIIFSEADRFGNKYIHFKKDIRIDNTEKIRPERFIANIEMFSEAQHYNTGLNRKVSINKNGDIKNYISHQRSFGNVNIVKLKDVIDTEEFTEKWMVSNNLVETCKDCQYRYSCISNSDLQKEGSKWYKKEMCSFDVATSMWKQQ